MTGQGDCSALGQGNQADCSRSTPLTHWQWLVQSQGWSGQATAPPPRAPRPGRATPHCPDYL